MENTINKTMGRRYNDLPLTDGERSLVDWQYRRLGGFFTHLWNAMTSADGENLHYLSLAFPEHVEAYKNYTSVPNYWSEVKAQAVKEHYLDPELYMI